MNAIRTLLLAGAAFCGTSLASASAALMPVSDLGAATNGHVVFAVPNNPVGTTYGPGVTVRIPSAAGMVGVSSNLNVLERNDQSSYIDSNFAATAQFVSQCGYSGVFSCNPGGAVTLAFLLPTTGFTVSADDFDTSMSYTFTATVFSGATVLGTLSASSLADNGALPAVLAATSTVPITSVTITDPTGNFVLADIGVVPEPVSLSVFAAGLLGIAALRRRRA